MCKFANLVLFLAICAACGWMGKQFASAQTPDYKCYIWMCQGTVLGCTFPAGPPFSYINACYVESGQSCTTTAYQGVCTGTDDIGEECQVMWTDCQLNP